MNNIINKFNATNWINMIKCQAIKCQDIKIFSYYLIQFEWFSKYNISNFVNYRYRLKQNTRLIVKGRVLIKL